MPGRGENNQDRNRDRLKTLNISVDGVPYIVEAEAFSFNDEQRFHVKVNGGPDHIFAWDDELKRLRALDDDASTIPESLEENISQQLLSGRI